MLIFIFILFFFALLCLFVVLFPLRCVLSLLKYSFVIVLLHKSKLLTCNKLILYMIWHLLLYEDWIMFKIGALFITTLFVRLYSRVGILLERRQQLHDRTISLIGEAWRLNSATFFYWSTCSKTRQVVNSWDIVFPLT